MTRRNLASIAFAAAALTLAVTATREASAACDYNGNGCNDNNHDDDSYSSDSSKHEPEVGVALDLLHTTSGDSLATGMYGLKTSMHARLGRRIALGFGLEQGFGTIQYGLRRYDLGWTIPELRVYLTPTSKLQLYTVLAMDMRVTHFEGTDSQKLPSGLPWGFFYMGGSMGAGIESRTSKTSAFRVELRGFMRGRVDGKENRDRMDAMPEFAQGTRTDKGVLLSLGLIFF